MGQSERTNRRRPPSHSIALKRSASWSCILEALPGSRVKPESMSAPSPEQTPWHASIVTRITLVFATLLVGIIALMGWIGWRASRAELITQAHHAMDHSLAVSINRLQNIDRSLGENLDLLATEPAVLEWCAAKERGDAVAELRAREAIAAFFEPVIRSRNRFAQVRLIGADPEGREVVRFDRSGRDVYRVPDELLQPKGDRSYYRATMAAPPGARLSFPIDLNREYERLERPFVPTMRVSVPLFTPRGARAGMVVINADMRQVFNDLLATADSGRTLVLARGDGEVLVHPDSALTFRFEVGGSKKLDDVLPRPTADVADEEVLVGYQDFTLGPSNDRYVLALTQPMSGLLGAFKQKRNMFIGVFAAIAFGAILLIILFALGVRSRLNRLTDLMERYAVGSPEALPVDRRDEFGRMTRGLRTMQERIDARVKELESARSAAEASDRQRQDLLANMSHEVRTPLNAIIGMGGEVDTSILTARDRERMAIVKRSAERLKGLVDDLLMHARIGEGKLVLHPAPVDMRTLIGDVVCAHLPVVQAKGISVVTALESLPPALLTDALRAHQVIDNLVGNAVRFTQHGTVTITAEMVDAKTMRFAVADTGPGIPQSERTRIFERFERATASDQEHGAGLGLAITKRVVDLLGGTITLKSEMGKGSEFTVLLPAVPVAIPAPVPLPELDTRGLRILYVEDVATNRMLLQEWGSRWGWILSVAETGEEALACCARERYDLLLIDLGLGQGLGGIELVRQLRRAGPHRHIPMVALTAHASDNEDADVLRSGMNDRVTKPADREELQRTVAFWCDRSGGFEEPDLGPLDAQYDNDPEKLDRVYQQYCKEFTEHRLALRAALRDGDQERLRNARHILRPHWQLLGLTRSVAILDGLDAHNPTQDPEGLEMAFRSCDRAFLRASASAQVRITEVARNS